MTTKDPLAQVQQSLMTAQKSLSIMKDENEKLRAMLQENIHKQIAGAELEADHDKMVEKLYKTETRLDKLLMQLDDKNSPTHRLSVDLGGAALAQSATELVNLGVRGIGRWSSDGWWAKNVDLLQGGPHFFFGLLGYVVELASRKGPLPHPAREVVSEATKVFAQLGFSNIVRACRIRLAESATKTVDQKTLNDMSREYQDLVGKYNALVEKTKQLQGKKG